MNDRKDKSFSEDWVRIGGEVDRTRAALAIYGPDLDPEEISARLGLRPSSSHRRGDRRTGERSGNYGESAWLLVVEGNAPIGPNELVRTLLSKFPSGASFWDPLVREHRVQVRLGIFMDDWNRGFTLDPDVVQLIANTGATMEFDLYFDGEDDS